MKDLAMGDTGNWGSIKIAALGGFLLLGAAMGVLSFLEHRWPTVAGLGYYAFAAYTMFLGALFAAYHMPVKDRAFAIFCILGAATVFVLATINFVPMGSMNLLLAQSLGTSLFLALGIYGIAWGLWGLVSGAIAFWHNPPPRLNGWQRIGIVASIAWVIGAWVYMNNQQDRASSSAQLCLSIERERENRVNAEAEVARCWSNFHRDLPMALAEKRKEAVVSALGPVALGWMFAYFLIAVVRWVLNGFRRPAGTHSTRQDRGVVTRTEALARLWRPGADIGSQGP
jgi:hypothetical protein